MMLGGLVRNDPEKGSFQFMLLTLGIKDFKTLPVKTQYPLIMIAVLNHRTAMITEFEREILDGLKALEEMSLKQMVPMLKNHPTLLDVLDQSQNLISEKAIEKWNKEVPGWKDEFTPSLERVIKFLTAAVKNYNVNNVH